MKGISAIGAGLLTLGLCAVTHAQMGFRTPDIRGVWNPVVGAGGVYQMERGAESKMSRAFWTGALALASVLAAAGSSPEGAELGAKQSEAAAVVAPAETVRMLQATLGQAVQRFEAQDMSGVLAYVSDRYRTGPLTKPAIRDQLIALSSIYEAVSARIRIDEVQMVGEHAWVYSTGEVSGRLRFLGTWIVFLSWQHELEVARQEAGGWRLFGYQQ